MAKIIVYGSPRKMNKQSFKKAASFFCDHLLNRLSKNITVKIKLKKNFYKETKCFGNATWTDSDAKNHNHREFEIEMESDIGPVYLIRTLAHEIVHVKQYARKELIDICVGSYQKWNNKMYNENMVSYKDLPWEQEAIHLEKEMYKLWKDKCVK